MIYKAKVFYSFDKMLLFLNSHDILDYDFSSSNSGMGVMFYLSYSIKE